MSTEALIPATIAEQESPSDFGRATLPGDFAWTFVGNAIYAACQWAFLVVLAKWADTILVGTYTFALAIATPIVTFATFQLRSIQVSDVQGDYKFGDYLGFRLWTMVAALLILPGITLAFSSSVFSVVLIELVGLSLAVEALSDVIYGEMQFRGRMDQIAKSMIVRGLLSISAFAILIRLQFPLSAALWAVVVMRLLVLCIYDVSAVHRRDPSHRKSTWRLPRPRFHASSQAFLLKVSLPVALVSVLGALNTSVPRYFIQWIGGPRELGLFAALTFFQSSGNMVVGALGQAAFGRLARTFALRQDRQYWLLILKLMFMALALGGSGIILASLFGKQVLTLVFRPEYATEAHLLTYLMIAAAMSYVSQFIGYAVTAARVLKPQIPLFIVTTVSLTLSAYWLTPRAGMKGAITAMLIANVVQFGGLLALLWFTLAKSSQPAHNEISGFAA